MHFRTQIPILREINQIDYNSRIVSLGSCFAVNMAQKFEYFKFRNTVNPFGILFHPIALERFIGYAINHMALTDEDLFHHNERWHCFDAHSGLSQADKDNLLEKLNTAITSAHNHLKDATHIVITLGTAWVYREIDSGNIVANCHKIPQIRFKKEILAIEDIAASIERVMSMIQTLNPTAQIIFTVSPVRHIKDGFVENQRSKSHLIAALHHVIAKRPLAIPAGINYFPSYEIMIDELRDYRFYTDDMLHPNQTAIEYIWKRFCETWVSETVFPVMDKVNSIQKALSHKPINPDSDGHRRFVDQLNANIFEIQKEFLGITF